MKEVVHVVNNQLVGVYTESEYSTDKNRPTILFLNSGLLPHIGPYRLYVKLARSFAKLGFNCFRFDLSGIGDSEKHKDSRLYKLQHRGDIKDVIDYLQQECGDQSFIALGICTGADNAHQTLYRDDRVVGAVSIDGYTYPTKRYYFNYYLPKLFSLSSWMTLFRLTATKIFAAKKTEKEAIFEGIDMSWNKPPKNRVEKEFRDFIQKDKSLLAVYTASWPYNYKDQLSDVFSSIPFGSNLQTAYLEDAEHIFPLAEDRAILTDVVSNWLQDRFIS
ncbi:MAG: alpha/beta fold hydrolase [Kangiellaceae bacterium]|nr:alpha/beta fold hydrolase [Kangiellaceae bacterium]